MRAVRVDQLHICVEKDCTCTFWPANLRHSVTIALPRWSDVAIVFAASSAAAAIAFASCCALSDAGGCCCCWGASPNCRFQDCTTTGENDVAACMTSNMCSDCHHAIGKTACCHSLTSSGTPFCFFATGRQNAARFSRPPCCAAGAAAMTLLAPPVAAVCPPGIDEGADVLALPLLWARSCDQMSSTRLACLDACAAAMPAATAVRVQGHQWWLRLAFQDGAACHDCTAASTSIDSQCNAVPKITTH